MTPIKDAGGGAPFKAVFPVTNLSQVDGISGPRKLSNPEDIPFRRHFLSIFCGRCNKQIHVRRGSEAFRNGPYKGGYLCTSCYVLHLDENPDPKSSSSEKSGISEEARKIRMEEAIKKGEILHDEEEVKAWLTDRGTVLLDLRRMPFGGAEEYDPDRYRAMMRAWASVREKCQGLGYE